jgi:nitroreductase
MDVAKAVAERWSPRSYVPEPVPAGMLREIFEAGRASHSCFNEQPWSFLIATKADGAARERLESLLDAGNAYAKDAWVLGLSVGKKTFAKTGGPNRHAGHDVGSASAMMSLRAFELGLGMRFMAGYSLDGARRLVPVDFEPYAMFVIGHPASDLQKPKRERRPVETFAFQGEFGNPAAL